MRRSALLSLFLSGIVLLSMSACSGGGVSSPNYDAAEDAFETQNYEAALQSVNTAIEQDSAGAPAYLLKARILRSMADSTTPPQEYKSLYQQAQEAEEEAVNMNPALQSDVAGRQQLEYITQMQNGIDYFNRANQSQDSLEFVRAASYFNAAHQIEPDSSSPYLNEAFALLNANQRQQVISPLEGYVERADSVDATAYQILGQLYLTNDRSEDAMGLLESATEDYPDDTDLQSLLLNAYNSAGATDRAMQMYETQVQEQPNNAVYRYNYGSMLLNSDQFDAAIEQLQKAAELDPNNVQAHYNLGAAHVNKAVAVDDTIKSVEDAAREADRDLTAEENQRLDQLVEQRGEEFAAAIPALEEARSLAEPGDSYRQDICQALFSAYVQTEQQEKAQQVAECAGYSEDRVDQ